MPLAVPNLDDRTFDQLVSEGRSLIPRYSAAWTNFNPSDPGITLLELFAYLAETAIFELNQIPDESVERFLRLVGVCRDEGEELDAEVGRALAWLESSPRSITEAEFDTAAVTVSAAASPRAARAKLSLVSLRCEPEQPVFTIDGLRAEGFPRDRGPRPFRRPPAPLFEDPTDAALVTVVPAADVTAAPAFALQDVVHRGLKERAPLGTRIHVVLPEYAEIQITMTVARRPGSGLTAGVVEQALARFLDPIKGGPDGTGWPFGRAVYRSELFQLLEGLTGVDHVEALDIEPLTANGTKEDEGVTIPPTALVSGTIAFLTTVKDAG